MKSGHIEIVETSKGIQKIGTMSRRIAIFEFIFRIIAIFNTIGSAILMGTTHETLPFFTRFIRFRANYDDLPALPFFVVANAVVSGYLILSLPLTFVLIVNRKIQKIRILLIVLDVVMLCLLSAGASSAAAIVYLAHTGNKKTNWFAVCQQFSSFCERISGSLIGSFIAVFILILLIFLSAIALSRHHSSSGLYLK